VRPFILLLILLTSHLIVAQKTKHAFRLERGQLLENVSWKDSVYRFPNFLEGSLNFMNRNTTTLRALYNLNIFFDRIEIISERGDTVPMNNTGNVQFITMNDNVFFNHKSKGFLEIVQVGKLNLGIKHYIKVVMESGTGERFAITDNGFRNLTTKYDRVYTKEKLYFLISEDLTIYRPTIHTFMTLLPNYKDKISDFFKINKLDLRIESDLFSLINYCKTLQ
jgi:hypothetical protein